MKDYFDEAAERLLGDLRNLEITLSEEDITEDEEDRRRHALIVDFLRDEFRSLSYRGVHFDRLADRLTAAMNEAELPPIEPDEWNFQLEEFRHSIVSDFLRGELSATGSHP